MFKAWHRQDVQKKIDQYCKDGTNIRFVLDILNIQTISHYSIKKIAAV